MLADAHILAIWGLFWRINENGINLPQKYNH